MTIWNLGSINADHFYALPHLPAPGETLAATSYHTGLGGKGANQSVAAARAGAEVYHIGAVGPEGGWAIDRLADYGVGTGGIAQGETPTGHAIINVAADGENAIVIFPGANTVLDLATVTHAMERAQAGDLLLMQNETSLQAEVAAWAVRRGMRLVYSAAPFDVEAVRAVLPFVDVLMVNQVEAQQLSEALDQPVDQLPVPNVVVTLGADGAAWYMPAAGERITVVAPQVDAVDTTGAGDTFAGFVAAGLDAGLGAHAAMQRAAAAAALKVTKRGTADAIPPLPEVLAFMETA
ncbi:MAG: ribokinase [Pseudomonadota bacterium]